MLLKFVQLLFEFYETGVTFTTKANSSSMSAGPSMIPLLGF
jgi:hypothetical protein